MMTKLSTTSPSVIIGGHHWHDTDNLDDPSPQCRRQQQCPLLVFEGPVLGLQKDQGPDRTGLI